MLRKKIVSCLMAALLLVGCSAENMETPSTEMGEIQSAVSTQTAEEEKETPLVLAVGRNFAETNPLQLQDKASLTVLPLLYESLVTVDENYHWQPELALEIQRNGLEYVIALKDGVFSDGTEIRASDVVNSMMYAKQYGSPWSDELAIVQDCTAVTAKTVRITLYEARQDFENLLTFPIVQEKNDGSWLGSGQYVLKNENSTELFLEANPTKEAVVSTETIGLVVLPNTDTLCDSLKIGSISCIFDDLSSGEAMKLSARSSEVEIGHLLFLGVNGENGMMSNAAVRKAIYGVVDRQLLADRVYASRATATTTPFHPNYYRMKEDAFTALSREYAQKLLKDAGLTKNAEGFYGSEEQSSLKLLYNSENAYRLQTAEMLQQELDGISLKLELVGLPYAEYMAALEAGDFDLYLGELAIDASMDIERLLTAGNGYGYGSVPSSSIHQVYQAYQQGNASVDLFLSVYRQNLPMIPLLYRQGLVIYEENVKETFSSNPAEALAALE